MFRLEGIVAGAWAAALGSGIAGASSAAAQPVLTDIGVLPGHFSSYAKAVSADGSTVVGQCHPWASSAFRWSRQQGIQPLGVLPGTVFSEAIGASSDGSVIVGSCWSLDLSVVRAFRWTATGGMTELSSAPIGGPEAAGVATCVSPDGTVAAGFFRTEAHSPVSRAARWADGAMTLLPVEQPFNSSSCVAIGTDGSIAGHADNLAVRWPLGGERLPLGTLSPATIGGVSVYGMSLDGGVIVGSSVISPSLGFSRAAFRWVPVSGIASLGSAGGGKIAYGVSADGRVIVGGDDGSAGVERAYFWTQSAGVVDLRSYLIGQGVNMHGVLLRRAVGVSADGATVVGVGSFGGDDHAFIVTGLTRLQACNEADIASLGGSPIADGRLTSDDVVAFLTAFFEGNVWVADLVTVGGFSGRDGQLTADDVVFFLARFFAGCA
ncbi:MAG: GC-type dockerin domain-anchored protein [Phycisphaerales bacterium]